MITNEAKTHRIVCDRDNCVHHDVWKGRTVTDSRGANAPFGEYLTIQGIYDIPGTFWVKGRIHCLSAKKENCCIEGEYLNVKIIPISGKKEEKTVSYAPAEVTGNEDVLDTRLIEERIQHLLEELTGIGASDADEGTEDELASLIAFRRQVLDASEYESSWEDGVTLVATSYQETYAKDHADDCGYLIPMAWPQNCIDWEKAAKELFEDYSSADLVIGYRTMTYWFAG